MTKGGRLTMQIRLRGISVSRFVSGGVTGAKLARVMYRLSSSARIWETRDLSRSVLLPVT